MFPFQAKKGILSHYIYHYDYHYHYHQRCSPLWVLQEQLDILDKLFLTERWESKYTNLGFPCVFPVFVRGVNGGIAGCRGTKASVSSLFWDGETDAREHLEQSVLMYMYDMIPMTAYSVAKMDAYSQRGSSEFEKDDRSSQSILCREHKISDAEVPTPQGGSIQDQQWTEETK